MQIVWDKEAVEQLRKIHTLLELETFDVKGQEFTPYCVISAEQLGLENIPSLGKNIKLHEEFIVAMKAKDYTQCQLLAEQLKGKFGGDFDTFYEEILKRHI